ncbi:MAG: hypothetical protein HC792_04300 [Acaryochloridaceae cyanobacterium CSU_5_19]|nr:hypothetical protein [Acaryochloridaceae cyanobacterium CSU_5_19]
MSEINSWEYSLVGDFFAKFNWSGKEIALAAPNSGSEMLNWQLQTVQTFLGRLNWTGESVKHLEHLSALQGLSTSLAVKDFFSFLHGKVNQRLVPYLRYRQDIRPSQKMISGLMISRICFETLKSTN